MYPYPMLPNAESSVNLIHQNLRYSQIVEHEMLSLKLYAPLICFDGVCILIYGRQAVGLLRF